MSCHSIVGDTHTQQFDGAVTLAFQNYNKIVAILFNLADQSVFTDNPPFFIFKKNQPSL